MNAIRLTGSLLLVVVGLFMIFTTPPQDNYGRFTPEAYTRGAAMLIAFVVGVILIAV